MVGECAGIIKGEGKRASLLECAAVERAVKAIAVHGEVRLVRAGKLRQAVLRSAFEGRL